MRDGATLAGISRATGVPLRTLHGISRRVWVSGETAAPILAFKQPVAALRSGVVPVLGSSRRVQALASIGWSLTEQARRLGWLTQQVWQIAAEVYPVVTESKAQQVEALFERLCSTPGPSKRARTEASRKGWLPPLAWDDIDDPDAELPRSEVDDSGVDEVAVERALAGERLDLTDAEVVVVLRMGIARGLTLSALTAHLGLNYFTATKLLGIEKTPRKLLQERVEAELRRAPNRPDSHIAALLDVHHQTVTRARARLAKAGVLVAA